MIWRIDKRLAWGIGVALGGIALTLAATFLPHREVHHALSLNVFDCQGVEGGARVCTAFGRLSIGNTGNVEQSEVRVHFPGEMAEWRIGARVFDIRASAVKRPNPGIFELGEAGAIVYAISPLPENTVVDFECQCLRCPEDAVRALAPERIRIEAAGRVAEGDPRVTTILRGLMNLLRVVLPVA